MGNKAAITRNAWAGLVFFVLLIALIIFGGAATLRYWQGWLYWLSFTGWVVWITAYFLRHDPNLVASRTKVGPAAEQRPIQKLYQGLASAFFIAVMLVPALDHRFGWSSVPVWGVIVGLVLVSAGFAAVARVMAANAYASSTIEVQAEQKVIDTGPYARVRHPMYAGALLLIYGTPLALGSWWGLIFSALLTVSVVVRLLDEERVLAADLPGYAGYMARVRSRLIPGVW